MSMYYTPNCAFMSIQDGYTPLHCACQHGRTEIVQLLLSKDANPHTMAMVCRRIYTEYRKDSDIRDLQNTEYRKIQMMYVYSTLSFQ